MRRPTRTRSCCGCMTRRDQSELLRVVKSPSGTVAVDEAGHAPGRGAYLCKNPACLEAAHKKKRLPRVLRTQVDEAVYDEIAAIIGQTGGNDHR